MKPAFDGRRPVIWLLALAAGVCAQVRSLSAGDTLDTSTPAPAGLEASALPAAGDSAVLPADTAQETAASEPAQGGFLMPIDGDVFFEPDLRVLISMPGNPPASMVLLVDGYSEPGPLTWNDGLVTAHVGGLKKGVHQLTLLYFNERTEIIGRYESRFFIRLPEPVRQVRSGAARQFGRVAARVDWKSGDAKGRILSQSELSVKPGTDTILSGDPETPVSQELEGVTEAAYNVKFKQLQAYGKVLLRTDEDRFRQPSHRFTANVKYGPWVSLKAGDIYPLYNPLLLNGTRVRGGEGVLNLTLGETQWGSLRVVNGQSRREVSAYIAKYDTGNGTRVDTVPGTFAQNLTAVRLGLGGGARFDMGFTLMKASDDIPSDDQMRLNTMVRGLRPAENLVPGVDLRMGFWDGKLQVFGNSALSLYTRDKSLGVFALDTFDVAVDPEQYEDFIIINATTRGWQYLLNKEGSHDEPDIAGFIGSNSAYEAGVVASIPLEGLVTETELRYSHLGLEYHSEGNPFLGGNPGDGFTLIQKLLVLDNRLSLGLELGNYAQDIGIAQTVQRTFKAEMRFTPGLYHPSVWIGGGRSNIAPEGAYSHQFRSSFLNFNTGGYHQFQLPSAKLHTTVLYGFTQSDLSLQSSYPEDDPPEIPTTRTHIVNGMAQYKFRRIGFLPRLSYTFSNNGIQQPTHSVTTGFLQPILDDRVKLDLSTTVGQYPESNDKNDVSLGASANVEYVLGPQQTFRLREKWSQYGKRRNLLVGASYELFF